MQFIMQCHVGWKYDLCGSEYQKNVCYSMTVHFRISLPGIVSQYDTTVEVFNTMMYNVLYSG